MKLSFPALLLLAACRDPAGAGAPALVLAGALLTAPFQALAEEFMRRAPGHAIELHFAGTPRLVMQLREGAPADVFASADDANMQRVVATGRGARAPAVFAQNRLAIVAAAGNPRDVSGLADLGRGDLVVVLCGPEVPAGRYAREALSRAGVPVRSASDEPSVKAVVAKVRLGEADAGIVYATDAEEAGDSVHAVALPAEHDVVASYPIVALTGGPNPAAGEAFVAFVRSADGRAVLRRFGFEVP